MSRTINYRGGQLEGNSDFTSCSGILSNVQGMDVLVLDCLHECKRKKKKNSIQAIHKAKQIRRNITADHLNYQSCKKRLAYNAMLETIISYKPNDNIFRSLKTKQEHYNHSAVQHP